MALEVSSGFIAPDQMALEVVERKGLGHPDTLVDGMVETTEIAYAQYCLERFGAIPHHNLDKASLLGGLCVQAYGGGEFEQPVRMLFMGRASQSFGGEEIPLAELQDATARSYLARVMPHLDTADPRVYQSETRTSTHSTRGNWFAPRSIDDLPEYGPGGPTANDTATMISYWPLTATERLALDLEGFFYLDNPQGLPVPRLDYVGQDVKVMCVRKGNLITATLCVPQVTAATPNEAVYREREHELERSLQAYAEERVGNQANVQVQINTQTKKSGRPYLVTGGACTDFGEEGAVGRGNKTHGIISSFRPNTMEAPHGKNPTYFVGKVLGYQADLIARRVSDAFQTKCQVVLQANIGDYLYDPSQVIVSTEQPVAEQDVQAIVEQCLGLGRETTNRIVNDGHFIPRTNSWQPHEQQPGI